MLNKALEVAMSWHKGSVNGSNDVMLGCQTLEVQTVEQLRVPEEYSFQVLEGH